MDPVGARNPLVLASQSPRRLELLAALGMAFEVRPSGAEEPPHEGASPDIAVLASRIKARSVARDLPDRLVLGADTVVCVEGRVLGKPGSPGEARRMLEGLRDRWHEVITGLTLVGPGGEWTDAETTRVRMRRFSDEEMEAYIAGGEPMDKAGAYAIQGGAGRFVEAIEGDFYNVVGLPLALLLRGLSRWMDVSDIAIPPPPERFRSA